MNSKELIMRRTIVALLAVVFLSGSVRPVAAQQTVPTVTIMLSGAGELEADLEAIMKMGGSESADQWPIIQAILPAFNAGIDPARPIRVDIIFGADRDYRISIPYSDQKDILQNIQGFIGARPRRIGAGLYALKSPAFNGFLRDQSKIDYVVIAADRNNIPANFDPAPELKSLLAAGYDLAASVKNTAEGVDARRKAIDDLRKELLGGLKKADDETELEFKIRRVGLVHQLEELERLFADSESLVMGWTTDAAKKEARMDLELVALPGSDLEKSIVDVAANPSLFSSAVRSDSSMFFGRVNHGLDAMRKAHLEEMLGLLTEQATAEINASEKIADDGKAASTDAATAFFDMLKNGSVMGVFDGFADIRTGDKGRSIVGTIRAADGTKIRGVLASLKEAGWDIELAAGTAAEADDRGEKPEGDEAAATEKPESADEPDTKDTPDTKADSDATDEAPSEEADAAAPVAPEAAPEKVIEEKPESKSVSTELAIHRVTVPVVGEADFQNLFGQDGTLLVAGTSNAVYYAAGPGAEELLRQAVAESGEDPEKNDGTFIDVWAKLGPWLEYLKERRARREAGEDLSQLTKEEQMARKERAEIRDLAIKAFSEGQDTIHMQLKSQDKKVTGLTVFSEGILRFVGRVIGNVAETKLQ